MSKIYLKVAYSDKDAVKSLGARWDNERKSWYAMDDNPNIDELEKYMVKKPENATTSSPASKPVLDIPVKKEVKLPWEEEEEELPDEEVDLEIENPDIKRLFGMIEEIPDKVGLDFEVDTDRKKTCAAAMGADLNGDVASFMNQYDAKLFMLWDLINNQKYEMPLVSKDDFAKGITEDTVFMSIKKTGNTALDEVIEIGLVDAKGRYILRHCLKPSKTFRKFSFDIMKETRLTRESLSGEPEITKIWQKIAAIANKADSIYLFDKNDLQILKQSLKLHNASPVDMASFSIFEEKIRDAKPMFEWFYKEPVSFDTAAKKLAPGYEKSYNTLTDSYFLMRALYALDKNLAVRAAANAAAEESVVMEAAAEVVSEDTDVVPVCVPTESPVASLPTPAMSTMYLSNVTDLQDKIVELVANGHEYVNHIENPGAGRILLIYK